MITADYILGLDDAHVNESRWAYHQVRSKVEAGHSSEEILDFLKNRYEENVAIRNAHRKNIKKKESNE